MTLQSLADLAFIGRTKTEVLEAIADKLGLSFEQFCRSALLAQGDFAAFLKADKGGRGELLERMTGTEIYGRVSMAAHERNRREAEALARTEQDLGSLRLLGDEARAALVAERDAQAAALADAAARVAALEARARAWTTRTSLEQAVQEAQGALDRALAEEARQQDRFAELSQVEQALPQRARLATRDRHAEVVARLEGQTASAAAASESARAALAVATEALAQAQGEADAASRDEAAQAPALAEAEAGDAAVARAQEALERAQGQRARTAALAEESAQALLAHDQRDQSLRADVAAAQAFFGEDPARLALGREPAQATWRAALEAARAEEAAAAEAAREEEAAKQSEAELGAQRQACAAERAALQAMQAQQAQARAQVEQTARADTRARRAALSSQRERCVQLRGWATQARDERARRDQAALAEQEAGGLVGVAAERHAAAERLAKKVQDELAQVTVWRERMQAQEALAAHRAGLRPGEPCPLCGAAEHPWAALPQAPSFGAEFAQRAAQLGPELLQAQRAVPEARAPRAEADVQQQSAAERRQEREATLTALATRWAAALPAAPALPARPEDADALPAVESWSRALAEEAAALEQEAQAHDEAQDRLQALQQALALAQSQLHALEQVAQKLEGETRHHQDLARAHTHEAEKARVALDHTRPALAALLGPGPVVAQQPRAEAVLAQAAAHARTLDAAQAQQLALESERRARAAARDRAAADADAATKAHAEAHAQLERAQQARSGLLGGLSVAALRASLGQRRARVEDALRAAAAHAEAARSQLGLAEARWHTLAAERAEHQTELTRDEAELTQALQALGLTLEQLRATLARDDGWVEAERTARRTAREAVQAARTRADERAGLLAAHLAASSFDLPQAAVAEGLGEARAAQEAAQQAQAAAQAQLGHDDELRARAAALAPALAAQRQRAAVWADLDALIGSANGSRFKGFAQGLTLEALLEHANGHLQALARRYALMRVPGTDLDLQVIDHDMADEVRSVHSLSGGEGFLVSLALALGLSSLASRDAQVETLFIDEGFGSLDPETLESALATLDALQAQGRQLGLISHIPNMAERVGAQVRVTKQGAGRSRVVVTGPT
jgi:exonuclease SbcC